MSSTNGPSPVAPHTEYARGQSRCPECGEPVSAVESRALERLCVRCRSTRE